MDAGNKPKPIDFSLLNNYLDGIGRDLNTAVNKSNTAEGKQQRDILSRRVDHVSAILNLDLPSLINNCGSESELAKWAELSKKIETINDKIGQFNAPPNKPKGFIGTIAAFFSREKPQPLTSVKTFDTSGFKTTIGNKRRELLNKDVESQSATVSERMNRITERTRGTWAITSAAEGGSKIELYSKKGDGTARQIQVTVRSRGIWI